MVANHYGGVTGHGFGVSDLRGLYEPRKDKPVETRLDWKELNKFSLYTPILRVIGDTARKCGAEARFVQTENFLDDCAEVMIELRRAGDSTLLDFNTLVQMIEDQGTLAADFSGVRRIVEVSCALLPNPKPEVKVDDIHQAFIAAAIHQQQIAMQQRVIQHQMAAVQYQKLAQLAQSPDGGLLGGAGTYSDQIKAYLGLKP